VFVQLAYTPLVVRYDGDALFDQCGRPFAIEKIFLDEEGSVLLAGKAGIALLDDRDLGRYAGGSERLAPIRRAEVAARFDFIPHPAP